MCSEIDVPDVTPGSKSTMTSILTEAVGTDARHATFNTVAGNQHNTIMNFGVSVAQAIAVGKVVA
jgi:hypothetical protein